MIENTQLKKGQSVSILTTHLFLVIIVLNIVESKWPVLSSWLQRDQTIWWCFCWAAVYHRLRWKHYLHSKHNKGKNSCF